MSSGQSVSFALLVVMLVVSMVPDAREKADDQAGLAAALGFALVAGLSSAARAG
jgi:zinc transporter, ZIP family